MVQPDKLNEEAIKLQKEIERLTKNNTQPKECRTMKKIFALFFSILLFNCSEPIPTTIDTDIRTAQKDQIWIFLGEKSVLRKEPKLLGDQRMVLIIFWMLFIVAPELR